METGQSEAKVLCIRPTEYADMRAAQNQPAAGPKNTPHFRDQLQTVLHRNMLDHYNAGDTLKTAGGQREFKPVALMISASGSFLRTVSMARG